MKKVFVLFCLSALAHDVDPQSPIAELKGNAAAVVLARVSGYSQDGEILLAIEEHWMGTSSSEIKLSVAAENTPAYKQGGLFVVFLSKRGHYHPRPLVETHRIGPAIFRDNPKTRPLLQAASGLAVPKAAINKARGEALRGADPMMQRFAALEYKFGEVSAADAALITAQYKSREEITRGYLLQAASRHPAVFTKTWIREQSRAELRPGKVSEPFLLEEAMTMVAYYGKDEDASLAEPYLTHEHYGVFNATLTCLMQRDEAKARELAQALLNSEDLPEVRRRSIKYLLFN